MPPAGLRAFAPVGAAAREVVAEHAAAGVSHAHCPVNEHFEAGGVVTVRGGQRIADLADLGKRQFARQIDAHRALRGPEKAGVRVEVVGLGAHVEGQAGDFAAKRQKRAEVGNDRPVYAHIPQRFGVPAQRRNFPRTGQYVQRNIHFFALRMGGGQQFPHLRVGEIARRRPQPECRAADVHRVRAEAQRCEGFLEIAAGGEQFGFLSGDHREEAPF